MGALTGIFHLRGHKIPALAVSDMTEALAHRGPSQFGLVFFSVKTGRFSNESYWFQVKSPVKKDSSSYGQLQDAKHYNLALGSAGLGLVDSSPDSNQPMSNRVNGVWVVFNGEIYNHLELRHDLEEQGHVFFSESDTEVIIHLYEEYGIDFINMLKGMFAIALFDLRQSRLVLIRDRFGTKPLYFTIIDDILVFASEIKALLKYPGFRPRLNEKRMLDYFTYQNTYGPETLFEGVELLEPGCFLVTEKGSIEKKRYWNYSFDEGPDRGEKFHRDAFRDLFEQSVSRRLAFDGPIGLFLSGGIDSGAIAFHASKIIPRFLGFTVGFRPELADSIESLHDEQQSAELMSSLLQMEHYRVVLHPGDMEWALKQVIWHIEELRLGMCYPHFFIARLAGKFARVALSGIGSDEILGGYTSRYRLIADEKHPGNMAPTYQRACSRLIVEEEWPSFFSDELLSRNMGHSADEAFLAVINEAQSENPIKKALHFDSRTFLQGLLLNEDKLSMAHGLEVRLPFLDEDLLDFIMKLPVKYLIDFDLMKNADYDRIAGKRILRMSMDRLLPSEIIATPRHALSPPKQMWHQERLGEFIRELVLSASLRERNYFKPKALKSKLDEHFSGKANHRLLLWSLMSFEIWNRLFIDGH